MSNPKEPQNETDDLELDAETVEDLEPKPEAADEIRGGYCARGFSFTCPPTNPSGMTN